MKDFIKKYIVYIHECPNGKKYIGTTSQKSYKRWHGGHAYIFNQSFMKDIQKYGWNNIKHIIVKESISQNEAYLLEQKLIKKYNTTNEKYGYNKQNGGQKNKNTNEIKEKIRNARIGKKLNESTKQKLSKQKVGIKNPMYGKKPANCRKINQYDLQGNFIKTWNDIEEIEKQLKIYHSNIIKCCKGERKTTGGFKWCYYEK